LPIRGDPGLEAGEEGREEGREGGMGEKATVSIGDGCSFTKALEDPDWKQFCNVAVGVSLE
jgi:hypothetical protein